LDYWVLITLAIKEGAKHALMMNRDRIEVVEYFADEASQSILVHHRRIIRKEWVYEYLYSSMSNWWEY
jgi:hypothetical protein